MSNWSNRKGRTLSRKGDGKVIKVPVSGEKVTKGSAGISIFGVFVDSCFFEDEAEWWIGTGGGAKGV